MWLPPWSSDGPLGTLGGIDDIADVFVHIGYANMARMNRIRAWARKNGAVVNVRRHARDAWSGEVRIRSPWNETREVALAKAQEMRSLLFPGDDDYLPPAGGSPT